MSPLLALCLVALAVASFAVSPRLTEPHAFYRGYAAGARPPGVLTLVLSQVTTWIFARSLLTAALLGYAFGIVGGLAYTAYYLSFVTGAAIVDGIRFRHGCASVQDFLRARFGDGGVACYNAIVGLRLLSEVFANVLVVGLVFGPAGTEAYLVAVVALSLLTLAYSAMGGLRASLKTDELQMAAFLAVMAVLMAMLLSGDGWSVGPVLSSSAADFDKGWNLLVVALLQVWSYPLHDPVMMDRGFIADRRTTARSFLHAAWLSMACILAFSLLGVYAGLHAQPGEAMMAALGRLLGETAITVINLALIISAVSTLDSTLSSAAKLTVVNMRLGAPSLRNGRIAMALFMLGGLAFLFVGSQDLYAATAVSGTASLFLTPVVVFSIWGRIEVPRWSYHTAFAAAVAGAVVYYVEDLGRTSLIAPLFGITVKYNKLLLICVLVLAAGFAAFAIGAWLRRRTPQAAR